MKKIFTAFVFTASLFITERVVSQTSFKSTEELPPAKIISFEGVKDKGKITLQWTINENETTDRFDVEKSTDGINFTIAALVFTSEKIGNENYVFYEKIKKNTSLYYRLKLYGKSHDTSYSKPLKF